jgi:hypothetical protein
VKLAFQNCHRVAAFRLHKRCPLPGVHLRAGPAAQPESRAARLLTMLALPTVRAAAVSGGGPDLPARR